MCCSAAAWWWLPWEGWLGLAVPEIAGDARRGLLVLIILFCANLSLTVLARLAYGLQLSWLANAWAAAAQVLTLLAVRVTEGGPAPDRLSFGGGVLLTEHQPAS